MKMRHDYVATSLSTTTKRAAVVLTAALALSVSTATAHTDSAMKMRHDTNGLHRTDGATK